MAKVWNEDIPAVGNSVLGDVADIKENLEFHAFWAKERRSVFTYNGGTTAYTVKCKSAFYYCKDKVCWWDAELTTGAIAGPVKDDWYYLYLDNSGITSGTEITNSELLWSATEPVWSDTYAGWYNGDDRCIFAARTDGTPANILEFFHEGDFVIFANEITDRANADLDVGWVDITLTIPKFARVAHITLELLYVSGTSYLNWRTNGQTGGTGHRVNRVEAGTTKAASTFNVMTDSSQIIEVTNSADDDNTVSEQTHGWYFPVGL